MSQTSDSTSTGDHTPSSDARQDDLHSSEDLLTRSMHNSDTGSGQLEVRCPNCHAPSEIAVDTRLTDLTCSACGSHFSLVDQGQETRMAPSLTQMGRFELIERIGVGGFGSVWKARDKELDRTVAIKIPRQGGMTAEEQEKFFREARAAAQLRHPSIVSVHEVGRDGESVYIVSDFVRGVTLGDWLTGQQLTSREAAELTAKIAGALDHAHEQGVVHRDLKPANIMMDLDNEPHLMDFGLARRDVGEVTVTMDGQVLGTPAYMSPEQAQGEGHSADRRSDVYSLGVILFQLLTGELPFRGNARMLIHQVLRDEPPSPRKLSSNVSKDLETITLKCLEKEPANRYQSAQDLATELRRFLAGEPILARPISRLARGWRWCKRKPAVAALSAILLLGLVSISTIAPAIAARQTSLRHSAEKAEVAARVEAQRAAREAETANRLADFVGAKYALSQGRLRDAYQQITSAIKSQQSWEYGRILGDIVDQSRRDWQLLQRIPCQPRTNWGCFVGPGPKWIVFARDEQIEVRSLVREHPLAVVQTEGASRWPCAVGDERIAVATVPGTITIYTVPELTVVATCQFPGKPVEIRSNAKGDYFVALNDQGLVRVYDRDGRQRAERQFKLAKSELAVTPLVDLSPSGRAVLFDPSLYSDKKSRWLWETDDVTEFALQTHQSRLRDDDTAWGVWVGSDSTSTVQIVSGDIGTSREQSLFFADNFLYSSRAMIDGVGSERGVDGLALISEHAINVIHMAGRDWDENRVSPSGAAQQALTATVNAVRYPSIWPHAADAPRFLAYDDVTRTLALTTTNEILLFTRWLPNTLGASIDLNGSFWSLDAAGDSAMVMFGQSLQIVDMQSLSQRQYSIEPPAAEGKKAFAPWGIAVTPDARWAAVLWQESDAQGTLGSGYFRKHIRVYELPSADSEKLPRLAGEVPLHDYFGVQGRSNRELWISPDATTVAFCTADGLFSGYRVADGAQIYKTRIPHALTFAKCSDPPLLGAGDARANGEYRVWNVVSGELVAHFPLVKEMSRSAFALDGKSVYIGTSPDELCQYRLSDGAILSRLDTPVLPVTISSTGNRFLGFSPDTPTLGSLVLADLSNGRTLEVINPTAHTLNDAYFSSDGLTFAFMLNRYTFRAMKSLDIPQAQHWLQYAAIEPQLAAASDDFLDYRKRLAERHITQGDASLQGGQRAAAWDSFRLAQHIIEGLVADFPADLQYEAILARNCERLAANETEPIRRGRLLDRAKSIREKLSSTSPEMNVNSDDPQYLNAVAWGLATSPDDARRNGKAAVTLANKACELTSYRDPQLLDTLAAAYADAGDFDAAIKWSEEAVKLLNDDTSEEVKTEIKRALENYKAKKPTRQPPPQEDSENSEP